MSAYPFLTGEIAKRGLKKIVIAKTIGVCDKALNNKLQGKTPFTWPEACTLQSTFFPDIDKDEEIRAGIRKARPRGPAQT